jgi:hypothetical protein
MVSKQLSFLIPLCKRIQSIHKSRSEGGKSRLVLISLATAIAWWLMRTANGFSKEGCHDLGRQMAGKSKVCYEAMVAGLVATIAALFDGSRGRSLSQALKKVGQNMIV